MGDVTLRNKLFLFHLFFFCFCFSEHKSMLTDNDWKKLWMEAGHMGSNSQLDNSIDSSDVTILEDNEVSFVCQ
jgi:hypothetical protein